MALTRVRAIADPGPAADPAYAEGLRRAVGAAVAYGLEAIGPGEGREPPIPVELLAQARTAARNAVSLDTVLRRYFAGYSLLGYFMIEEAGREGLIGGAELQRLVATQAGLFDRLLAAIGEEHTRESRALHVTSEQKRAERIERLLGGELIDTAEIPYDFESRHLGLVASGAGALEAIREVGAALDCRVLTVVRPEGTLWGWLGRRRDLDPAEVLRRISSGSPGRLTLALGEAGEGLSGWRFSHRQAAAARAIAQRGKDPVVRYADVALLASVNRDELLNVSLRRLYLAPLAKERDGGETLRKTLRAYLAAGRNASAAAARLGISRQTAGTRLRTAEKRLGKELDRCASELDIALRLEQLAQTAPGLVDSFNAMTPPCQCAVETTP